MSFVAQPTHRVGLLYFTTTVLDTAQLFPLLYDPKPTYTRTKQCLATTRQTGTALCIIPLPIPEQDACVPYPAIAMIEG